VGGALALTILVVLTVVAAPSAQAHTFKSLYSFVNSPDGATPYGALIKDKSGNLYGTTRAGGSSGAGTVFEVNPKTKQETVLYSFTGQPDGATPFSGLVIDKSGNLYGTTFAGGSFNDGIVYKVNIKTQQEPALYSFAGDPDGGEPVYGNLLMDKSGNLYGTTQGGGSSNRGSVWELKRERHGDGVV
jgi:uncharacterized repeat protein (TIGR03803 family)